MKKIITVLLALVALAYGGLLQSSSAHAACGANWLFEKSGETISVCDEKTADGTFASKVELADGEPGGYILNLTLDNYNGGEFKFESYSAGINVVKVVITLVGENVVSQGTIMPGSYWGAPVEIKGEEALIISDVVADAGSAVVEDEENKEEDGSAGLLTLVSIAAGAYVVVSIIVFVILGLKIKKLAAKK